MIVLPSESVRLLHDLNRCPCSKRSTTEEAIILLDLGLVRLTAAGTMVLTDAGKAWLAQSIS